MIRREPTTLLFVVRISTRENPAPISLHLWGNVRYTLKSLHYDSTHVIFEPLDVIARMAIIQKQWNPEKRTVILRYL